MNIPTRALLASPLGFLIGLSLGTLGGGGSILAVPALVYGAGQSPSEATAGALLIVAAASLVGTVPHLRAGRVRVVEGVAFGVVGIGGSFIGTALNESLNPDVLLLCFSGLILIAAWRMATACPGCTREGEERVLAEPDDSAAAPATADGAPRFSPATIVKVLLAGTAIGFLTGLFGVGGGFVIVPALTLLLKFPMPEAVGTSLLIIFINSVVALLMRIGGPVRVDWATTLPFVLAAILGVLSGSAIASRVHARSLLRWFAALLVAVAVWIGVGAAVALA